MRPTAMSERAGHGGGREARERSLALVRHDAHPFVRARDRALDVGDLHRALQLDRDGLAVAAHRADAHAEAVDRNGRRRQTEDLVAFRAGLEFLAAVAVAEVAVDPRQQAPRQRKAESFDRHAVRERRARTPVDVEDRARGIFQQRARRVVQVAHLREQLAHLARARARGRLVGHRRHPLDEARAKQAAESHQHEAHGAVAADPVAAARRQRGVDHRTIHRVEDDDRARPSGAAARRRRSSGRASLARAASDAPPRCNRRPGRR